MDSAIKAKMLKPSVLASCLQKNLSGAEHEKDVENAYRSWVSKLLPEARAWSSPYGVDGLLPVPACSSVPSGASLLAEFKWDLQLTNAGDRAKILAQVVYYLKRLEGDVQARKLPTAVLIGDVNEFFLLPTECLLPYLCEPDASEGGDWDWSVAPSQAFTQSKLVLRLVQDTAVNPSWVWTPLDHAFDGSTVVEVRKRIVATLNSTQYHVAVNPQSMVQVFQRWRGLVLHKSTREGKSAVAPQEQVGLFMRSLLNRDSVYQHPKSPGKLVVEGSAETVRINPGAHDKFWQHFRDQYSVGEKRAFTANKDRLVEEETRRRSGEFFTPPIWVDEAHRHLDETLGPDWRDRYVVWDCSCGLGNLTRDYRFKNLYLSTLNREDVETIKTMRYNGAGTRGGATVFHFDFLNDSEDLLPSGLREALADPRVPVLFLNNPPYGTANDKKAIVKKENNCKAGVGKTSISAQMKQEKIGANAQLYTQFMFRMGKLVEGRDNVSVALFSKSDHMRSASYQKFTSWWLQRFRCAGGFLFRANEFADVSGTWAVCWNVWSSGTDDRSCWTFDVKTCKQEGAVEQIRCCGSKNIWISNSKPSKTFIDRERSKDRKQTAIPSPFRVTGATNIKDNKVATYAPMTLHAQDVFYYNGSNHDSALDQSQVVFVASAPVPGCAYGNKNQVRDFAPTMVLRDLIPCTWLNNKDEFLAPDEQHCLWTRWWAETLLFLPLCGKGEFSGLRDLCFPDPQGIETVYQVKNHWALLPYKQVKRLADRNGFDDLYADCEQHAKPDRYCTDLYDQVLEQEPVSDLARKVFELARELTVLTITAGSRKLLHEEKPELHLQAWDAGWKQTRKVLEQYHPAEWAAWKGLYDEWRQELRTMVYEIGYLRQDGLDSKVCE